MKTNPAVCCTEVLLLFRSCNVVFLAISPQTNNSNPGTEASSYLKKKNAEIYVASVRSFACSEIGHEDHLLLSNVLVPAGLSQRGCVCLIRLATSEPRPP